MAISTWTELKTALASWLNRSDLTSIIPDFIVLAEATMNKDQRLRTRHAVTRGNLSVSSQFTNLPSDWAAMINVQLDEDPDVPLLLATPQELDRVRASETSGDPRFYCIVGTELEVAPVPTSSVTLNLIYHAKVSSLGASVASNWLLAAAPDAYLYLSLANACTYLHEDERAAMWMAAYDRVITSYAFSSESDQTSGSPLVIRSDVVW